MYLIILLFSRSNIGVSKAIEGGKVAWVCFLVLIEILEFKLFCKQEQSVRYMPVFGIAARQCGLVVENLKRGGRGGGV